MTQPSPQRVLTLIHGTFSPHAAWTQADSRFFQALKQRLGGETIHRRITWPGLFGSLANNGHDYRLAGAKTLVQSLKESFAEFPDAEHWVIAHSHGGNVALYALRDPEVAQRLDGIVTMAAPFIQCKPRSYAADVITIWPLLFMSIGMVLMLVLFAALALYVLHLKGDAAALFTIAGTLAGEIPLFILWLKKDQLPAKFAAWQKATLDKLTLPTSIRQRMLCLSIRRDEAGGLLKGMHSVAAWPHWLWDGLLYLPLMLFIFLAALIFGDAFLSQMSGKVGWDKITGAFNAALGWGILIGFVHLLVMAILPRFTRALSIGFGQESIVDNLLVDIRSDPAPADIPGLIHQQYVIDSGGLLAHSRLYQSDEVISDIAAFIQGQPITAG
ncbi:MAG: hypothetical protein IV108_01920 [Burkholderiales bacterium]|nr:hypothetical protein [Burkholderiales bacterium]